MAAKRARIYRGSYIGKPTDTKVGKPDTYKCALRC